MKDLSKLEMDVRKVVDSIKNEFTDFPKNSCRPVSAIITLQLCLYFIEGRYVGPGVERARKHCWNYSPKTDKFVDATAYQFQPKLPKVFITERKNQAKNYSSFDIPKHPAPWLTAKSEVNKHCLASRCL